MSKPTYAFLATPGGVDAPNTIDTDRLLKIAGANTGNFMFQYAADKLIGGTHVFVGESGVPYGDRDAVKDATHLIVPAANHFRVNTDWSGLTGYIRASKLPTIVLGLGAQAPKTETAGDFLKTMTSEATLQDLGQTLSECATMVTVRGTFSETVCETFGVANTIPLGCPSLLINPNKKLGHTVQAKLDASVKKAKANEDVKLALTAASPFEIMNSYKRDLERVLFRLTREQNGIYIQQSGGPDTMAYVMRRPQEVKLSAALSFRSIIDPKSDFDSFNNYMQDRGRVYWSVESWMAGVKPFDVCFGTRLHGNMAALAADVPGVVITHDARTSELVDMMCLPYLDAKHIVEGATLASLLENVQFDADKFDANRIRIAKILRAGFEKSGIEISDHLIHMTTDADSSSAAA